MGRVIAIANQKGGVGKTTTAVNLGACLAQAGQRVLIIDADPQGNASSGLGVERRELDQCIYDVLINDAKITQVVRQTTLPGLNIVPATLQLAGAEIELASMIAREAKLKKALESQRDAYDFILIDCPPSLGLLTLNALAAADSLLIPIQSEYYALEGLGQLMHTVQLVQQHLNAELEIEGVLLTMYDARTNLSIQVVEEVKEFFKEKVFQSVIPRNVRLSEAPSHGQPIVLYDNRSKGAEMYSDLAKEVLSHG